MELSVRAGSALIQRGDKAAAARVLAPFINNPHGGAGAARAKAMLEGKDAAEVPDDAEADDGESMGPRPD